MKSRSVFSLTAPFGPAGDQFQALQALYDGYTCGPDSGNRRCMAQTLMGITGSGKTYTVACLIEKLSCPVLVITHNKTLAAQLYSEFKEFFPHNHVGYFVSYYDYYQPEAYLPVTDTYIEKDAQINEKIDRLRHEATSWLLSREDVIIVASVSSIYGLGSPESYRQANLVLNTGMEIERHHLLKQLISMQYERSLDLRPGCIRAQGDTVEIMPPASETAYKIDLFDTEVERIREINPVTGATIAELECETIFPATHYVLDPEKVDEALKNIEIELKERKEELRSAGRLLEAQRISSRTRFDMEMIREIGYCQGIENYSRHFEGRKPGEAPYTLLDYFPENFLTIIDESHMTVPQLKGMYRGDRSRKENLVEHGFRLPSAFDNRPLMFSEFEDRIGRVLFVSATPSPYEFEASEGRVIEQIIRPTGLLDPEVLRRPCKGQVDDLMEEIRKVSAVSGRVLVTALTRRMAEDLTGYMQENGVKAEYMHADVDTLDRIRIIRDLRLGRFDVLVGINLLREGLDLPEVMLVAVLDADKEGFLRSDTALIQTIGRAARNSEGRVILYGDRVTGSMKRAMEETERRRETQTAYNRVHNIVPKTVIKDVRELIVKDMQDEDAKPGELAGHIASTIPPAELDMVKKELMKSMKEASSALDFERAAELRDELRALGALAK